MSLPMTVVARRNARLRAAALATIPLLLFIVAAIPRIWAPDLVPFGEPQAAYVLRAVHPSSTSPITLYADPSVPLLAFVDPLLRALPDPIVGWVVLRGLLDAVGVSLLYLAAHSLVGVWPGVLAALLYAASPTAWAAARDPSGPLGAVMVAAALLAAVRLVERPTLLRGAVFGVTLGLLARSVPVGLVPAMAGAATLALCRASWKVGGLTALGLILVAGPALFSGLDLVALGGISLFGVLRAAGGSVQGLSYPFLGWFDGGINPFHPLPRDVQLSDLLDPQSLGLLALGYGSLLLEPGTWLLVVGLVVGVLRAGRGLVGPSVATVWAVVWLFCAAWLPEAAGRLLPPSETRSMAIFASSALVASPPLAVLLCMVAGERRALTRWIGLVGLAYLFTVAAAGMGLSIQAAEQAEWERDIFAPQSRDTILADFVGPPRGRFGAAFWLTPTLREVIALADAVRDVTGRVGDDQIVQVDAINGSERSRYFESIVRGAERARPGLGIWTTALPLEHEATYLTSTERSRLDQSWPPSELRRPSSVTTVLTPSGADTGARIVTLRPRSVTEWLSGALSLPDGRFADGSVLLAARLQRRLDQSGVSGGPDPRMDITLYWQLPLNAGSGPLGNGVRVALAESPSRPPGSAVLPSVESRRPGEIVVQVVRAVASPPSNGPGTLQVTLYDEKGGLIRTSAGAVDLDVPLGSAAL